MPCQIGVADFPPGVDSCPTKFGMFANAIDARAQWFINLAIGMGEMNKN